MSDGSLREHSIPKKRLEGAQESTYVKSLRATLRAARLNNQYPDARKLSSHVQVLAPETHRGIYPGLEVDLRSGLPTYKEWTRAQTDVQLAADQLRQLGARAALEAKAKESPGSIFEKQLAKLDYYSAVRGATLTPLGDMAVQLRNVDPKANRAAFHVMFDKLDASGVFVRYSIDLVQTSQVWTERVVVLDEEAAQHTQAFRSLIYKFTSLDSEFTLVKLATMGGLAVERVIKGVIGPVWLPWSPQKGVLEPALQKEGSFVASFSLDMAAVDIAEDRDNDPFEDLVTARLSDEARVGYDQTRNQLRYKVYKDRKFVVPRTHVAAVQQLTRAQGTNNIVYGV